MVWYVKRISIPITKDAACVKERYVTYVLYLYTNIAWNGHIFIYELLLKRAELNESPIKSHLSTHVCYVNIQQNIRKSLKASLKSSGSINLCMHVLRKSCHSGIALFSATFTTNSISFMLLVWWWMAVEYLQRNNALKSNIIHKEHRIKVTINCINLLLHEFSPLWTYTQQNIASNEKTSISHCHLHDI